MANIRATKNHLIIANREGTAAERASLLFCEIYHLALVAMDGGYDDISAELQKISFKLRPTSRALDAAPIDAAQK